MDSGNEATFVLPSILDLIIIHLCFSLLHVGDVIGNDVGVINGIHSIICDFFLVTVQELNGNRVWLLPVMTLWKRWLNAPSFDRNFRVSSSICTSFDSWMGTLFR